MVSDLCKNSSPEKGLCCSDEAFELMNKIKEFNYKHIYLSDRLIPSIRFFELVLNEIYNTLKKAFDYENTLQNVKELEKFYPKLSKSFSSYLCYYYDFGNRDSLHLKNKVLFDIHKEEDFVKAILYYISGMTDNFAMEIYNEIIGF